jgi:hypothetical protein
MCMVNSEQVQVKSVCIRSFAVVFVFVVVVVVVRESGETRPANQYFGYLTLALVPPRSHFWPCIEVPQAGANQCDHLDLAILICDRKEGM